MVKRNIKIILGGVLSLVLVFLAYTLLGDKPEIISDESLRVEEPVQPKLRAELELNFNDEVPMLSEQQIESSLENNLIDEPVASFRKNLIAGAEEVSLGKAPEKVVSINGLTESVENKVQEVVKEPEQLTLDAGQAEQVLQENIATANLGGIDSIASISDFDQASDVEIIPDSSGFLDLNLVAPKPDQEMVLVEGDQLIVDDINQLIVKDTNDVSAERVTAMSTKPSVFAVPEVDEALMQGDNEISKEYRQNMTKLISINAKLKAADEENAYLQQQFEMSVFNNRKLAQIIRDIDDQIKAITLTN